MQQSRFEDFCRGLVGQGRQAFERVLADPENVLELLQSDVEDISCESLPYACIDAYEVVTGEEWYTDNIFVGEVEGERWKEEDLPRLFPRVAARFRKTN
jgi:hypothetical protein